MRHGFIKAAAATPDIRVADCGYNAEKIVNLMRCADESGVKLLVLPELCVTGYTCGDLFLQKTLLDGALAALEKIVGESRDLSLLAVLGLPLIWEGKLFNCAAVVGEGRVLGVVPKTHLPNYGEFYELRHFSPAPSESGEITLCEKAVPFGSKLLFTASNLPEFSFAVELCEDLWSPVPPSSYHAMAGATVICNLSASNETVGKSEYRQNLIKSQSARLVCAYLYADAGYGESTTDMVFSAHNMIAENGVFLAQSKNRENNLTLSEIDVFRLFGERRRMNTFTAGRDGYLEIPFSPVLEKTVLTRRISPAPFIPESAEERDRRCLEILNIQAAGLAKRLEHTGAKTAVVGISGGLDSTLALLATARAFDLLSKNRDQILAITMPCFGTTKRTKSNAALLAEKTGATLKEIDITDSVRSHFHDIGHDPDDYSAAYENAQARERTQVLMDLANRENGLVVGTGDLSELALGWATYNGDHMSMYGVNSGVPKTLVRYLVRYCADQEKDEALKNTLLDILDTPVSPELLPPDEGEISQKTEELVGPYELHDFFLYYAVRWAFAPGKVYRLAKYAFSGIYDDKTIRHWLKTFYSRFFSQQFKRSCLPDGPKVGSVTLSPRGDWRMPSDAAAKLWLAELENL